MVHCVRSTVRAPLGRACPIDYFSTTLGSAFGRAVEPSPDPVGAIVALLWHGALLVVAGAESSLRCRVAEVERKIQRHDFLRGKEDVMLHVHQAVRSPCSSRHPGF